MAKKTKDSNLSLEERLEQALIPNWDEPYKLPDNWCWLKLLSAFENCTDSKKKIQQKDYLESGLWSVVDQGQSLVGGYTNDETMLYNGNLPVIIFGDHTRCVKYIDFNFAQGADGVKVLRPKPFYLPKFFFYALQNVDIPNLGYRRHFPLFDKFSIPLAPLEEQQRIVEHVESLFAKLDEAKEKAQEIVDGFEKRKAAILHKAFSGELTEIWRKENDRKIEEWVDLTFGDLMVSVKNGTTAKQTKEKTIWPVTRIETLQKGTLDLSRVGYVVDPNTISEDDYYTTGDIAFSHINSAAHVGKTALIESHFLPLVHGMNLLRIRLNDLCLPKFMVWYSRSSKYKELVMQRINMAVNQVSINQKQLKTMPIKLPTVDEQCEIVKILDSLITKELHAKETAETVIEQIEKMKKAILARAFRGELGTNDPSEESAVELLKKVLSGGEN